MSIKKTDYYLYIDGLKDMMKCIQKISKMSEEDFYKCFDFDDEDDPEKIWQLEPDVILKKVEEWEKKNDFCVGDEVVSNLALNNSLYLGRKGVITNVYDFYCHVLWSDGVAGYYSENELKKTGKKIYIEQILGELSKK